MNMSAPALEHAPAPVPQYLNSQVLREILAALDTQVHKFTVLDLGPARASSIEFFNAFDCRLTISDAIQALVRRSVDASQAEAPDALPSGVADLFADVVPAARQFDLILGWDVLDHLDTQWRQQLIEWLTQHAHPHTLLHVLLTTSQFSQDEPGRYAIEASGSLAYLPQGARIEHTPLTRYQLQKTLPQLAVVKAILMRNGLQEMALHFS